ncbi:MAG TPA: T9SS type A sorting domain-containing protein [Saprospiraceae bacterium]|nr:T9SS type A sorting domain-containing protein [Saprospiraceae bacterium]
MQSYLLKTFFFVLSFFFAATSFEQISPAELGTVTKNFLSSVPENATLKNNSFREITTNGTVLGYVAELSPRGFIVFTAQKKFHPILAFSFKHDFDFGESPDNILLQLIKADIKDQAEFLAQNKSQLKSDIQKNKKQWALLSQKDFSAPEYDVLYGPWLTSTWGEVNCVDDQNNSILVSNSSTPHHDAPGCVATSFSQILHYYKWPKRGLQSHTTNDVSGSHTGHFTADFSKTNYDWANMLDIYMNAPSTTAQQQAVGELMYHAGIALDMDWEANGSTSNVNRAPDALDNYFRFSGHYKSESWASFWTRFDENIENKHPIQVAISKTGSAIGHAMVTDGYRQNTDEERYYHLDMGWWGDYNAWYRIQGSFSAGGYNVIDGATLDFLPDPQFNPTPPQTNTTFTVDWNIADNFVADAYELQYNDPSSGWITQDNTITAQSYTTTVPQCGNYEYRVRAKSDGHWYANSYSEPTNVYVQGANNSLYFDSNDSYFIKDNAQNDLDLTGNDWTIEAWIKPHTVPASNVYPVILGRKYSFELYLRRSNGNAGLGVVAFNGAGTGFGIEASLSSGSHTMTLNDWHHVAATHDNNSTRLYIDGTLVGTSTDADFDLDASISALNVGARFDSPDYKRYLQQCAVDEIRISNTARYSANFTPTQVEFSTDAQTRLLMHLNDGVNITDASGHFEDQRVRSEPNQPTCDCVEGMVLPIELTDFSVSKKELGSALLTWRTQTEQNFSHFEIERKTNHSDWKYIATVTGTGNSHTAQAYTFLDKDIFSERDEPTTVYYRLKSVDLDEKFVYSDSQSIFFEPIGGQIAIYPNPTKENLFIKITDDTPEITVELTNSLGQVMLSQKYSLSSNRVAIDVSAFPKGWYLVKVVADKKELAGERILIGF